MKITNIMIDHVHEPLGFMYRKKPCVSWKVEDTDAVSAAGTRLEISADDAFNEMIYDSGMVEWHENVFPADVKLTPRTRYFVRVTVIGDNGESASGTSWFETGKMDEAWQGIWITPDCSVSVQCPVLEKSFSLDRDVRRARAYIGAVGLFELYVNGVRAGSEYLTPYCNTYSEWMQTIAFDITGLLVNGRNTVEIMLADGWYKGPMTFDHIINAYGDKLGAIGEFRIQYADGSEFTAATDSGWLSHPSYLQSSEIYDGEVQDHNAACDTITGVKEFNPGTGLLCDRLSLPVTVESRIKAEKLIITPAGERCLDFGQNISGWLEIDEQLDKGKELKCSFFEVLDPDGNFYNANLRAARQEFIVKGDGQRHCDRPHFTFYGFRYVKIDGPEQVNIDDYTACVVHSAMDRTGYIETSEPQVNRLFLNALWGQKDNFIDVPTDCPQRDERLGWTGDAQIFCGTACYNMDAAAFYRKFMYDIYLEQKREHGCVPIYVPTFHPEKKTFDFSPAWSDAAVIIPWELYIHSGDRSILEESYQGMRDWVEFMRAMDDGSHIPEGTGFGDWLALDVHNDRAMTGITPKDMIAGAYYLYSTELTAKAAGVLNIVQDEADYSKLADDIRTAMQREFVTGSGRIASDSQTANVLSLMMGFASDRKYSAGQLNEKVENEGCHLTTGFVGTAGLCRALSDNGFNDTAYRLLLNRDYPGWLYEVEKGATTIWERWNSIKPDGSLGDVSMNSYNHYSYGAVVEWLYRNAAGLVPCEDRPGFRRLIYSPQPDSRLHWLKARLESAAGTYRSEWSVSKKSIDYLLTVPFDCDAELVLPDAPSEILINGNAAAYSRGMLLKAGTYEISYQPTVPYFPEYSLDSTVRELRNSAKVWETILSLLPGLKELPSYIIDFSGGSTLRQILDGNMMDCSEDISDAIAAATEDIMPWDA